MEKDKKKKVKGIFVIGIALIISLVTFIYCTCVIVHVYTSNPIGFESEIKKNGDLIFGFSGMLIFLFFTVSNLLELIFFAIDSFFGKWKKRKESEVIE